MSPPAGFACPLPTASGDLVQLAHGGGGRLSQRLLAELFFPALANPLLDAQHDGAVFALGGEAGEPGERLAFTTDSFVVTPRFFPGGDIGSLAVHGTVNDLAMCGARPIALATGFILEEGLPLDELRRIVGSLARAAAEVGVPIATGDTKVVDRGRGDGVYISTTGIGRVPAGIEIDPRRARPGDVVLLSGEIGLHGVAILSVREGLEFETAIESDSAPLHDLVAGVLAAAGGDVHVLRDPTRGGVAAALTEIAGRARVGIRLVERALPVPEPVRAACEILGLDPLYVANEGKCLAIVAPAAAEAVLHTLRAHPLGRHAAIVGEVTEGPAGQVTVASTVGGLRIVDLPLGEQLPRIC